MAELRADGKRVLVTAGASGIGRAIAEVLLDAGAKVHICDIDEAALAGFRQARPMKPVPMIATRSVMALSSERLDIAAYTKRLPGDVAAKR